MLLEIRAKRKHILRFRFGCDTWITLPCKSLSRLPVSEERSNLDTRKHLGVKGVSL